MKPDIWIRSSACLLGALALLLIPLRWLLAALLAAAVHEGGHLLALKLLGVRVIGFSMGVGGACIETESMTGREELLSAMAGPAAGLLLLPLARWIPCTALCAAAQTLYNLLPLGHQDGGRILMCVLTRFTPKARMVWDAAQIIVSGLVLLCGVIGVFCLHFGILPVLIAFCLCSKSVNRKFPCKTAL